MELGEHEHFGVANELAVEAQLLKVGRGGGRGPCRPALPTPLKVHGVPPQVLNQAGP